MIAPSGEQITIAAGDQQAVVVEVGGGLRSYFAGGRELVDGYGSDEMCSSGRGQVLVAWPNRVQDGSYEFHGRRQISVEYALSDRGLQVRTTATNPWQ
jgi:aldose 1-epimerase